MTPNLRKYAKRTMAENVKGILSTFKETGRIGKIVPKDEAHAKRIARGISKATRARAKDAKKK